MAIYVKDPDARSDYRVDWDSYLGDQLIAVSEWRIVPQHQGGLAIADQAHDGRVARVTITGGIAGGLYQLTNHITLTNQERDNRSLSIRVEAR